MDRGLREQLLSTYQDNTQQPGAEQDHACWFGSHGWGRRIWNDSEGMVTPFPSPGPLWSAEDRPKFSSQPTGSESADTALSSSR